MRLTLRLLKSSRAVYFSPKHEPLIEDLVQRMITAQDDCIILPFSDHPGPLSEAILNSNFRSLTICEKDANVARMLKSHVGNKFPSRNIRVHNEDLFDLLYKQHCDSAQTRCANLVSEALSYGSQANILEEERSQKVKFLVPLMKSKNEAGFLRSMYYQVTLKLGLCCSMYIQYYFLMSDRQYSLLNAIPSKNFWLYRSSTVLFNTIFNINSLNAYDLKSGFGISLRSIQNTSKKYRKNYELVHLVSLLPREDVLAQFDPRSLVEFRFFVMQLMFRRSRQVTRFLRQWFDYSDKDIAHLGIDECTRTGDLTKEQCLQLYCYMRSLRGYRDSTFLQAARQGEENVQALDPDLINR